MSTFSTVHITLYSVHCTLHSAYYTVHTPYTLHSTLYTQVSSDLLLEGAARLSSLGLQWSNLQVDTGACAASVRVQCPALVYCPVCFQCPASVQCPHWPGATSWGPKNHFWRPTPMLFWPNLRNFWCSVVTSVTFSSNLSSFFKKIQKHK